MRPLVYSQIQPNMSFKRESQYNTDSQISTPDSQPSTSSSLGSSPTGRGSHRCVAILHGHEGHIISLALSGDLLYTGSDCGEIWPWEHPDFRETTKFGYGEGSVKSLLVVGDQVISAHQDHKIRIWRRSRTQPSVHKWVVTLPSMKDYLHNFLPSKNYVQVRRNKLKSLWINHQDTISVLAVGTDVLYSGSWDKSIKVWRLSDYECLESLNEHCDAVSALAVDIHRNLLYSGSADTTIKVFERKTDSHVMVATLEASKSPVNALALSPDGSFLYSGESDKTITVWKRDPAGKYMAPFEVLRGHRLSVLCVNTTGDLVLSGSADKTVRVWKRNSDGLHSCLSVLVGHTGPVKSLCISTDMSMGILVYSGSMDRDVRVWQISELDSEGDFSDDNSLENPELVRWRFSNTSLPS